MRRVFSYVFRQIDAFLRTDERFGRDRWGVDDFCEFRLRHRASSVWQHLEATLVGGQMLEVPSFQAVEA